MSNSNNKVATSDINAYLEKRPQVIEVELLYENVRVGDKLFFCDGLIVVGERLADVYKGVGTAKYMEVIR